VVDPVTDLVERQSHLSKKPCPQVVISASRDSRQIVIQFTVARGPRGWKGGFYMLACVSRLAGRLFV
jgi:hypothetical protein